MKVSLTACLPLQPRVPPCSQLPFVADGGLVLQRRVHSVGGRCVCVGLCVCVFCADV